MRLRRTYSVDRLPAWLRPWWMGIAYWDCTVITAVCYPLGLHWIVRAWHRLVPSREERAVAAWKQGRIADWEAITGGSRRDCARWSAAR